MPEVVDQGFELEVQQSLAKSRSVRKQAELTSRTFSSKNFGSEQNSEVTEPASILVSYTPVTLSQTLGLDFFQLVPL